MVIPRHRNSSYRLFFSLKNGIRPKSATVEGQHLGPRKAEGGGMGKGIEGERYGSFFLADWTIGIGPDKVSGVLASDTKFRTPRNSVININYIFKNLNWHTISLGHHLVWWIYFYGNQDQSDTAWFENIDILLSSVFFCIIFDF